MAKIKRTPIPKDVRTELWIRAGGRCQNRTCNKYLLESMTAPEIYNGGEVAHIIADSMNMVRGDSELSKKLGADINNLMLLCPNCHTEIDKAQNEGFFTKELLTQMKIEHENRIRLVTGITKDLDSHIINFHNEISNSGNMFTDKRIKDEILPEYYSSYPLINIGTSNRFKKDIHTDFWKDEDENLIGLFNQKVKPLIDSNQAERFLVFALAPIPLLIRLGSLLDDKISTIVYQKHRIPDTWKWLHEDVSDFKYSVNYPEKKNDIIALNLSLSATITNDRIQNIFPENKVDICTITIDSPSFDFLRTESQLNQFASIFNSVLDKLKKDYGHKNELHIFPSCPSSIAIEMGRRWFKKADMKMIIYDENQVVGGFNKAIIIKNDYL